jgi:hypothetical protein
MKNSNRKEYIVAEFAAACDRNFDRVRSGEASIVGTVVEAVSLSRDARRHIGARPDRRQML